MKKLKEFFINNQLISYINNISPLKAEWLNSTTKPVADISLLDEYILLTIGDSNILKSVESNVLNNIRTMINANEYRLNKLWDSVNFDYNPIENYNRVEAQTHNEKIEADNRKTTTDLAERTTTNTNGSYTDNTTTENKTTAFDTTAYNKDTDKNSVSFVKGDSTDTSSTNATTDTVKQDAYTDNSSGGYNLTAKGNIGTMSTQNMIEQERRIVNYNFYDEIVKLFELYIIKMCYESED